MRCGKVLGIKLLINDYFILLLIGYALLGVLDQTLILFLLVSIHETAHLLAAKKFGIRAREIELFPFGGVARIDGMLELSPRTEIMVALAGPGINFLLCLTGLYFWPWLSQWPLGILFFEANLMLGVFNLLPALPLDGGRALRSLLAKRIGFYQATHLVLKMSKWWAVVMGIWGLLGLYLGVGNLHTLLMAVFLYGAVLQEEGNFIYLFLRYLLRKGEELQAKGVLPLKQYITTKGVTLGEVVQQFTPGHYHMVLVVEKGGKELISLSEHQIVEALLKHGKSYPVGKLMSS